MSLEGFPEINSLKENVRLHWEEETCGIRYGSAASPRHEYFKEIELTRYRLEPTIPIFANFPQGNDKKVLEIGVGAGTDFANWVNHGAIATGIDLTQAAITLTQERLELNPSNRNNFDLRVADAENLPFDEATFDIVYSWGVLHHSPDTERAFQEVHRVLKPGGIFKGMIYHVPSWSGWMIWVFHCLLKGKPFRTVKEALYHHLESPGTKAYTTQEAKILLENAGFVNLSLMPKLSAGDLLLIKPSQKYQNPLFQLVWKLYPRWLVKTLGDKYGLSLLIEAKKELS